MPGINIIERDNYAIVELNRGKANPINTDLVIEIRQTFDKIKDSDHIRGVVLTGNTDGFFSVGLDLKELYHFGNEEIVKFWNNWDTMLLELTAFPKPMVAAINGYSPAGGCILALTCDYRVMADEAKFMIGLNELAVGIAAPENIYELYAFWMGYKEAYQSLMTARLYNPQEALDAKLVDEIGPMDTILPAAEKYLKKMLQATDIMLAESKMSLRRRLMARLASIPEIPQDEKLKHWFEPSSRAVMKSVVDRLSK